MLRSSTALRTIIVYRPPPSRSNNCTVTMFFNEFPLLLENLATTAGPILLAGDFNFHVDNNQDCTATRFTQLLDAFNLKQNILLPTHKSGSTLDLIITRADENIASKFIVVDPALSDHYMVGCTLSLTKVPFEKKKMGYRRLKSINFDDFRHDVSASLKLLLDENTNLNDNVDHYSKNAKISIISEDLDQMKATTTNDYSETSQTDCQSQLFNFQLVSCEELASLIKGSSLKSCQLDPVPALVLRQCYDILLPVITRTVNLSLQHGQFPDALKMALIIPLLKKSTADREILSNYRPISSLLFISKCCEKVVALQLNQHLHDNCLHEVFQSAYKPCHSTESALIRVHNDILAEIDNDNCVMLLFLDLSAAFDTVNHRVLL
ncbi:uncharacterized protein [Montipora capricornis]|uniref:uncharacterized protein n=1 Tax=Montipora capricornis TaxID=246305 RepID=UPI0035F13BB9